MERPVEKLARDKTLSGGSKTVLIKVQGNENYLEKIIRDAVTSEKRYESVAKIESAIKGFRFCQWELEDGSRWVSVDGNSSNFARIVRRVKFRLDGNKWISKKTVVIHTEHYDVPGQFTREHRNVYKEVEN